MEIPLMPGEQIDIWKIEAQIEFTGRDKAVIAKLTLPQDENLKRSVLSSQAQVNNKT